MKPHASIAIPFLAFLAGCSSTPKAALPLAAGEIGGDAVSSQVDSEIAHYFVEAYLPGKRTDARLDTRIDEALAELMRHPLSNERLKSIADRTSVDFAAMAFAHVQTETHLSLKRSYLREYDEVRAGRADLRDAASRYKFILVPGLFYRSKPETKGDLREVRSTLEEAGFEVASVPILEAGTVEENGRIIAEFIQKEPVSGKKLIVVSTSKGGPDTLHALGQAIDPESAKKVAVWFSVGGALRGSHLADEWTKWPKRWLASVIGWFRGFSADMVESLSVEASLKRMEQVRMPSHLCIVHFVGVPLSGTVTEHVRGGYEELKRHGPNDGITLLPDEILPDSRVITALGLDHWYRDPDLRRKILALASVATKPAGPCRKQSM